MISKDTIGKEYIKTQPTNVSEIKGNISTVIFTDVSMATISRAAFKKLSECKTLVFINTKSNRINPDAWLGLSHLESLSIEESSMITLDGDTFAHLKSLTRLKVSTTRTDVLLNFSKGKVPLKPATFRGLHSLNSLWLSLPNLNEHAIQSMDHSIWQDITDTLTELLLPENDFTELYDNMFVQFSRLKKLNFQANKIATVYSKALHGIELLKEIDLSQNRINELDPNTFQSLAFLNEINLAKNRIKFLADNLFKGLKQLRSLKLDNNLLKVISCKVFYSMDFMSSGGHPGKIKSIYHNSIISITTQQLTCFFQYTFPFDNSGYHLVYFRKFGIKAVGHVGLEQANLLARSGTKPRLADTGCKPKICASVAVR